MVNYSVKKFLSNRFMQNIKFQIDKKNNNEIKKELPPISYYHNNNVNVWIVASFQKKIGVSYDNQSMFFWRQFLFAKLYLLIWELN